MDHLKVYQNLIEKARARDFQEGEIHHIVPRSIYGEEAKRVLGFYPSALDNPDNLVVLSLREHYLCHRLLPRIFQGFKNLELPMLHAFNLMSTRAGGGRVYASLKGRYKELLSETRKGKPSGSSGKKWSLEARKAKSETHPMRGKSYEEYFGGRAEDLRRSRSIGRAGKKHSSETRKKLSERVVSQEWKDRISASRLGQRMSEEQRRARYSDQTVYVFVHSDGREILATIADMRIFHGCDSGINKVVKGKLARCKGWRLKEPV